jgi:hypothetical protein
MWNLIKLCEMHRLDIFQTIAVRIAGMDIQHPKAEAGIGKASNVSMRCG